MQLIDDVVDVFPVEHEGAGSGSVFRFMRGDVSEVDDSTFCPRTQLL